MQWYVILLLIGIGIFMFAVGFTGAMLYCDKKMGNLTVGDLYITKHNHEPYLVAKLPMEEVATRTYVTFEVRVVDDSQK